MERLRQENEEMRVKLERAQKKNEVLMDYAAAKALDLQKATAFKEQYDKIMSRISNAEG
jgi:hypothetical protein